MPRRSSAVTTVLKVTYIGGPTALLELNGSRFLTDPTFDPAGTEYHVGPYTLSHDHHYDNLDREGRAILAEASRVLTTIEGAQRLGGNAMGIAAWCVFAGIAVVVTLTAALLYGVIFWPLRSISGRASPFTTQPSMYPLISLS